MGRCLQTVPLGEFVQCQHKEHTRQRPAQMSDVSDLRARERENHAGVIERSTGHTGVMCATADKSSIIAQLE